MADGRSANPAEWSTHHWLLHGAIPPRAVALPALLDVDLLARCAALVLHLGSNLSRLALALRAARAGALPPYISLDGGWCPHWRMCCGSDGESVC